MHVHLFPTENAASLPIAQDIHQMTPRYAWCLRLGGPQTLRSTDILQGTLDLISSLKQQHLTRKTEDSMPSVLSMQMKGGR